MSKAFLSSAEIRRLREAKIPIPESIKELKKLIEAAERDSREIPLQEAFREIRKRLKTRHRVKQSA